MVAQQEVGIDAGVSVAVVDPDAVGEIIPDQVLADDGVGVVQFDPRPLLPSAAGTRETASVVALDAVVLEATVARRPAGDAGQSVIGDVVVANEIPASDDEPLVLAQGVGDFGAIPVFTATVQADGCGHADDVSLNDPIVPAAHADRTALREGALIGAVLEHKTSHLDIPQAATMGREDPIAGSDLGEMLRRVHAGGEVSDDRVPVSRDHPARLALVQVNLGGYLLIWLAVDKEFPEDLGQLTLGGADAGAVIVAINADAAVEGIVAFEHRGVEAAAKDAGGRHECHGPTAAQRHRFP